MPVVGRCDPAKMNEQYIVEQPSNMFAVIKVTKSGRPMMTKPNTVSGMLSTDGFLFEACGSLKGKTLLKDATIGQELVSFEPTRSGADGNIRKIKAAATRERLLDFRAQYDNTLGQQRVKSVEFVFMNFPRFVVREEQDTPRTYSILETIIGQTIATAEVHKYSSNTTEMHVTIEPRQDVAVVAMLLFGLALSLEDVVPAKKDKKRAPQSSSSADQSLKAIEPKTPPRVERRVSQAAAPQQPSSDPIETANAQKHVTEYPMLQQQRIDPSAPVQVNYDGSPCSSQQQGIAKQQFGIANQQYGIAHDLLVQAQQQARAPQQRYDTVSQLQGVLQQQDWQQTPTAEQLYPGMQPYRIVRNHQVTTQCQCGNMAQAVAVSQQPYMESQGHQMFHNPLSSTSGGVAGMEGSSGLGNGGYTGTGRQDDSAEAVEMLKRAQAGYIYQPNQGYRRKIGMQCRMVTVLEGSYDA